MSVLLCAQAFFCIFDGKTDKNAKIMQTSTLILLLAGAVVVLAVIVALMVWHSYRQERDMKLKDDSIVREVRRNQKLIDYA